jgi:hypothetical protein
LISKNDTSGREIDESAQDLARTRAQLTNVELERDELMRSKKDQAAKIQELTRKYAMEKDNAQ